jgi:hypothetical protein
MPYSFFVLKGRELTGKVGLFPQSYTAPAPPSAEALALAASTSSTTSDSTATEAGAKTLLQPLNEESESESPPSPSPQIAAPVPKTPAILLNGDETDSEDHIRERVISTSDGEVMKATMTDVQKAIEQLGRHGPNEDGDGGRSFSFASSRGDNTEGETDTDFDMSDVDGADGDDAGEGWHKGARRKLAAKARRAVEEAEKLEAMMGGSGSNSDRRAVAPPIEVKLSDESEGEEGDYTMHSSVYPREHPYILEEDEDIETDPERLTPAQHTKELSSETNTPKRASTGADSNHIIVPERDESEQQTATATRSTFPAFQSPPPFPYADVSAVQTPDQVEAEPKHSSYTNPTPQITTSPPPPPVEPTAITFPEPKRNSTPLRESMIALPSPTGSFPGFATGGFFTNGQSKHSSVASATSTKAPVSNMSQPPLTASSMQNTLVEEKKEKTHPTEWSVEDVAEWLKSKGFDQDVCEKFTHHGRSASAPTPPPYQSIQIPNVYQMTLSCPTSPSLLPMISRRSSHPGHPDEATSNFDYLPNDNYMQPSFGQAGQFKASLQVCFEIAFVVCEFG